MSEIVTTSYNRPRFYRLLFIVVVLTLHVLFAMLPDLLTVFGVGKLGIWFRDSYAMLAASDAAQAGYNPFVENPYDLSGERHIYSDWWYFLGKLGFDRTSYLKLGFGIVLAFWLAVMAVIPFRTRQDFWCALALGLSPPVWLAVNRANPDLLVFAIMTLIVPMLLSERRVVRILATMPLALATGLKFFPILGGIVLLCPAISRRENLAKIAVTLVLLVFLAWSLQAGVKNNLGVSWLAMGQFTFGAAAVPLKLGMDDVLGVTMGRVLGLGLVAYAFLRPSHTAQVESKADRRDQLFSLMGVAVLAGNFFLTVGFLYKGLFALWVLPDCLRRIRDKTAFAPHAKLAVGCLIGLVWLMPIACVTSYEWLKWLAPTAEAPFRRGVSIAADLLAWGAMVPLVLIFGASLRACWMRGEKWVS
ncbi:MAG: hypothetical protein K9M98_04400 [Cephaloticoccus sp.]|nr:hypothetical protein [Cephaloticoccus sp.]MCF7759724.1 hypothetical protein [Cephaloticoccus sp.]